LKIAFLVNDLHLSGGINVVVKHASSLQATHGHLVTIVVSGRGGWHEWRYPELRSIRVVTLEEAKSEHFDLAIATWWETVFNIGLLDADHAVWFMQSLEDRFYRAGDPMQLLAQAAYAIQIPVITEASWIRSFLQTQNPDRAVGYARNGIDKGIFRLGTRREWDGPLRVMIEGSASAPNKGVAECLEVVRRMKAPHSVTWVSPSGATVGDPSISAVAGPLTFDEMADVYRNSDVLLKLSRVEGMFGPPLEAFHCGATAVVAPVTGAEEYIAHGFNSLVVGWDDPMGTAAVLDELAMDPAALRRLQQNALATAESWPDWSQSSADFNSELQRLVSLPTTLSARQIHAQASILRSLRVPMRLMHENSISTLRVVDAAFRRIQDLEVEVAAKAERIAALHHAHAEKLWWDAFSDRLPVRILLALRQRWRRIRTKKSA
jgi:glycosyltransferase involved in cell wall biosynthesis